MDKVIYQGFPHFYDRMVQFVKANQTIKECDICFVGDSIIEMMGVDNFKNLKCVNRGIISDKSAGVLMTLVDRVIAINPKEVFLFIGSNDICDGYTLLQIENNLKDIIKLLRKHLGNIKIVLSTITPPCYYEGENIDYIYKDCRDILKIEGLNEKIMLLKNEKDNIFVFDSFSLIADENKSLRVNDTLDGVHLQKHVYDKWLKELEKVL